MEHRGHYFREWRKFRGLTQEQLADRIGINRAYLSKIESGKRRYDQYFLESAANILDCNVVDLLVRDPRDPEGVWTVWNKLSPDERARAITIMKALSEAA